MNHSSPRKTAAQSTLKLKKIAAAAILAATAFTFAFVLNGASAKEGTDGDVHRQRASATANGNTGGAELFVQNVKAIPQGAETIRRYGPLKVSMGETEPASSPRVAIAADFDADGVNDLLVAHADRLDLHRGDINAFAPQTEAAWEAIRDGRFVSPFERKTRSTGVPAAADFLFAGDFNRDARLDVAFAARGDRALYVLEGDGAGNFLNLRRIETAGEITALTAGDVNRADGLPDLIVGTRSADGFGLQIFSGLGDIFAARPLLFNLPSQAEALAVGRLDENEFNDIAVGTAGEVIILSGADSTGGQNEQPPELLRLAQPSGVKAIVAGDLMPDRDARAELATLAPDGTIRILKRGALDTRPISRNEHLAEQVREYRAKDYPIPQRILARLTKEDLRQPLPSPLKGDAATWTLAETVKTAAPNMRLSAQAVLTTGRLSGAAVDDLIVLDAAGGKVTVLPFENDYSGLDRQNTVVGFAGKRAPQSFDASGAPVAALAMKLNYDNEVDLLVLNEGGDSPSAFVSAPQAIFTVNSAVDAIDNNINDGVCNTAGGVCTLRAAIMQANRTAGNDTIMINAGINPTISLGQPDNDAQGTNDQNTGDLDITCVITTPSSGGCDLPLASNTNNLVIMGAAGGNTVSAGTFTPYPVDGGGSINTDRVFDVGQDGIFGGAFGGSTGVLATFTNLTIQNGNVREALNTAMGGGNYAFGGGIRYDGFRSGGSHGTLTVTNSTVTNNQSDNAGGGVYQVYGSFTTSGSTYSSNITKAGEGGGLFFGAATSASNVNISNSTFNANEARQGVVFGTFTANADGGGTRINADLNTVTIGTTNFTNNIAQQDAGAIKTLGGLVTVTGGTMTGNTARRHGGVAFGDKDTAGTPPFVTFSGSTMRGNLANSDNTIFAGDGSAGDGGAVFQDRGILNLTNVIIGGTNAGEPNTANNGGGVAHDFTVVAAMGNTSNQTTVTINGGSINGNVANTDGGGVYFNAQNFTVTASTLNIGSTAATALDSNKAKNNGGAINVSGGATANLNNMTIRSNQANSDNSGGGDGGAFYQNNGTTTFSGTMTIGGSGFANSAVNGGGIRNNAGTLTLPGNASFTFNTATGAGGAINNGGTINNFTGATINNNSAANGGGVANGGTLTMTGGTLGSNTATSSGGGMLVSGGTATLSKVNVTTNNATTSGGGFSVIGGTLSMSLSRIVSNTAPTGPALARTGGTATVESNWWGTSGTTSPGASFVSGTADFDPWLRLTHTASPSTITVTGATTLTASFLTNSAGTAVPVANLTLLIGLPITFGNPVLGSLSAAQTTIQASGTATATYTAGCTGGAGSADATVDTGTTTASIIVNKFTTTASATSNTNPSKFGQSVTFTATVTSTGTGCSALTGMVQFKDDGTNIGSPVTLTGGSGQLMVSDLSVGNHTITADYLGDQTYNISTGSLTGNPQVVQKGDTTTGLTSNLNPSVLGQSVTFTANIAAVLPAVGTPGGTVQFLDGGTPITGCTSVAVSGWQAVCTTSALTVGNRTITAQYNGDTNFNTSTGNLTGNPQVVLNTINIGDVSIAEGATGTRNLTFTVTLGGLNSSAATTVQYQTADDSATSPADYTAVTLTTLNIPSNTLSGTFIVQVKGDTTFEGNQNFFVNLSNQSANAVISDNQATGTIADDEPITGDFVGSGPSDGLTDAVVWNSNNGNWLVRNSNGGAVTLAANDWGRASLGDIAVPGDYDFDNKIDVAIWRPSEGNWYILQSSTGTPSIQYWGQTGDIAVPGDYDADGRTDLAVYRPSEGKWYVKKSGGGTIVQNWGIATDKPVVGDYDGDGKSDLAVFRPTEGNWYVINSSSGTITITNWGVSSDKLAQGDYDGDGRTDSAVYRSGTWFIKNSNGGSSVKSWGNPTDLAVPGDYDGDGKFDIAVWRPSEGKWYVLNSATNTVSVLTIELGGAGVVPIPNAYLPQ